MAMDMSGLIGSVFNLGNAVSTGEMQALQQFNSGQMPNFSAMMPESQLLQGFMTPESGVPGMGLLGNMPAMPSQESYMKVQQLQNDQQQQLQTANQDLDQQVKDHSDVFFANHHYDFDANGNPVRDDHGNIIVKDGPETAQQRADRDQWTDQQKEALQQQQQQQMDAFVQQAQTMSQAINPQDPNAQAELSALQSNLQQQQNDLANQQHADLLKVGLPPQLDGFVDQGVQNIANLQHQQAQQLANDPDQIAITNYQTAMQQYVAQQRAQMGNLGYGSSNVSSLEAQAREWYQERGMSGGFPV